MFRKKKEVEKIKMKIGGVEGFVRFMWETQQVSYVRSMKGFKKNHRGYAGQGVEGNRLRRVMERCEEEMCWRKKKI